MLLYWAYYCLRLIIQFSFVLASVNFIWFVFVNPDKQKGQCIISMPRCFTKLGNILWCRKRSTQGFDDSQFSSYIFHYLHLFHYFSSFQANFLCLWTYIVKNMAHCSLWVFWFPVCSTRQRKMTHSSIQTSQLVQLNEEMIVLA